MTEQAGPRFEFAVSPITREGLNDELVKKMLADYAYLSAMRAIGETSYGQQRDYHAAMSRYIGFTEIGVGDFMLGRKLALREVLVVLNQRVALDQIEESIPELIQSGDFRKSLYRHSLRGRIAEYFRE